MPSHAVSTAISAAVSGSDALTWWLASLCALAFVLAAGGAALMSAYQRKQRVPHPHPHYHRHTEAGDHTPPE